MIDTIHGIAVRGGPTVSRPEQPQVDQPNKPSSTSEPKRGDQSRVSISAGDISDVVANLNDLVSQVAGTKITFDVDMATGKSVIMVLNKDTGELIRQVPPEQLLVLMAKMEQLSGLIFNREV